MPTVRTVNNHGDTAELQVSDDLYETLKGKVRQDELRSVEVIAADAPDLVEVPVEYRPRPAALVNASDETPTEPVVMVDERNTSPGQVVPPAPASTGDDDADLEALRAEYERVFETAPDGRWQAARLRKELAKHQEG
jgi:hypothetical protein